MLNYVILTTTIISIYFRLKNYLNNDYYIDSYNQLMINCNIIVEYQIRRIDNVIYGPQIDINIDRRGLGRTIFDTMKKHNEKVMQVR